MLFDRDRFSLVQFNVENLFLYLDLYDGQDLVKISNSEWQKLSSSTTPNKPIEKVWALAKVLEEMNADILMLNEVGGPESLENFNKHFLRDRYHVFLKEGNSNRGIDVGYLVKKDFLLKPILFSHKNRPIHFLYPHETQTKAGGKSHYFSRDIAELRLYRPGENSPAMVILLTHLKSKLDPEGHDSGGRLRRAAELRTLVSVYNDLRRELGEKTPVIVTGDFNGIASLEGLEPEFLPLREQTDLVEIFEHCGSPKEDRYTQVQILPSGKQQFLQIDYIFVSPETTAAIVNQESGVYRFKSDLGGIALPPRSLDERDHLPSDHYPVRLVLNPRKL